MSEISCGARSKHSEWLSARPQSGESRTAKEGRSAPPPSKLGGPGCGRRIPQGMLKENKQDFPGHCLGQLPRPRQMQAEYGPAKAPLGDAWDRLHRRGVWEARGQGTALRCPLPSRTFRKAAGP